jgi:hypothetical protein
MDVRRSAFVALIDVMEPCGLVILGVGEFSTQYIPIYIYIDLQDVI